MIPVMIVCGVLMGRWWRTALVLGAVGWPTAMLVTGAISAGQIPVAALLGLANTGVGVALHQAGLWLVRRLRRGAATH